MSLSNQTTKLIYDPRIILDEHTKLKTEVYDLRSDLNAQKSMRDVVESLTTIVRELHEEVNRIKLSKANKDVVEREHLDASSTIDNEQKNNVQEGRYAQLMNRVEQLADKQHKMALLLNGTSSSSTRFLSDLARSGVQKRDLCEMALKV